MVYLKIFHIYVSFPQWIPFFFPKTWIQRTSRAGHVPLGLSPTADFGGSSSIPGIALGFFCRKNPWDFCIDDIFFAIDILIQHG